MPASAQKVAARYRKAMLGMPSFRKEPGLGGADLNAISRLVRVPDPVYVPIDWANLTWIYRQGIRTARSFFYDSLRRAFAGGLSPNQAVAVVSRSDLDPGKMSPAKGYRTEYRGRIPKGALYMLVTRKPPPEDARRWLIPVVYRDMGRWKATRPVIPWKELPTEDPAQTPAEAPADALYGEWLFGELRDDAAEPNTDAEDELISALRAHYRGTGDPFSDPPLSGAVAVALRKAHQDGLYPDWLQVPDKYRFAYRLMDNVSGYAIERLTKDSDDEDSVLAEGATEYVEVVQGGSYRPHRKGSKVSSWTVSKEAIERMVKDWRFRVSDQFPDHDEHIAIAVVDLNQVRDSFMLNPDRIAEIGLAGDFTYQHEVLGWGSFPLAKLVYGEVDRSEWEWGREQAEENEQALDEDDELDWSDLDGYTSVEEFDSDMAQFYRKQRRELIDSILKAL